MTTSDEASHPNASQPIPELEEHTDSDRRRALRKLGALAAWTTPTLTTFVLSARAENFGSPIRPLQQGPLERP